MIQITKKAHTKRGWVGNFVSQDHSFTGSEFTALQDLFPPISAGLCTSFMHTLMDNIKVFLLQEEVYFYMGINIL